MIRVLEIVCLLAFIGSSWGQDRKVHSIVIEVNVPGAQAYKTVMGNVANLKKAFSPETVDIEVVCEGRGIDMLLLSTGTLADQIRKANNSGVVFAACGNTVRGMHLDRKRLYPFAKVVDSGVAEVVRRQEAGYSYLKGAF